MVCDLSAEQPWAITQHLERCICPDSGGNSLASQFVSPHVSWVLLRLSSISESRVIKVLHVHQSY